MPATLPQKLPPLDSQYKNIRIKQFIKDRTKSERRKRDAFTRTLISYEQARAERRFLCPYFKR
jgi:hypothetical protein